MAKGLAVIQGATGVVFKALEDGTIELGTSLVSASVSLKGSLKLDIGSQADGYFLKSDVDGNATWAQITRADISSLDDDLSIIEGDIDAVSAALHAETLRAQGVEADISADLNALQSEFNVLKGDFDVSAVLADLGTIQEYLDGDGVSVAGILGAVGDITTYAEALSVAISNLAADSGGNADAISADLSIEEHARAAADAELSADLLEEVNARVSADLSLKSELDAEEAARIAGDLSLKTELDAEEAARISADLSLQQAIDNNLSDGIVDVTGVAGETSVTITEGVNGRTAEVRLANDVSVKGTLDVAGQATVSSLGVAGDAGVNGDLTVDGNTTLGNATSDTTVVNGGMQIPRMTRAEAQARFPAADVSAGTYDGYMVYITSESDANATEFVQGQKWYFCENGVWHASFFYA